jgi:ABC-type glycerol-3-phosphate transport system permease component
MTARRGAAALPHLLLVAAVVATFVPLTWMFGVSFEAPAAVFADPLNPLPGSPTLDNFRYVFGAAAVDRQLVNSIVFAGGVTLGQVLVAIPAAWAFARWRFPGSGWLFALLLLTMSVPFVVFYVPNYLLLARLDLLNTFPGLILPQVAGAYGIFLLRQHFRAFPREVVDAARVDGASEGRVLLGIVVPGSRSAIAALAVYVFISAWNEYVWPLLAAPDPSMQILTVGTVNFASVEGGSRWGPIMAAATLATAPALVAYLAVRKQILAVVLEGAVKG